MNEQRWKPNENVFSKSRPNTALEFLLTIKQCTEETPE